MSFESIRAHATRAVAFIVDERRESVTVGRAFIVGLAVVHIFFFASLASQVHGLVGSEGILPAHAFFTRVAARFDPLDAFWRVPSLYWFSRTDEMLSFLCAAGIVSALLLIFVARRRRSLSAPLARALTGVLYVLVLSFVAVGQSFLAFQWDLLLIECTVVALFFTGTCGSEVRTPSRAAVFLLRLLVVKLMMSSGLGKLATGDETWRSLDALAFHFFTQPLPNPLAVVVAHAPHALLALGTLLTLVLQIALPPLLFIGPRARALALIGLTLHQLAIALTGNFAYFNLLTVVLLVGASDDDMWRKIPGVARMFSTLDHSGARSPTRVRATLTLASAGLLVVLSLHGFVEGVARRAPMLRPLDPLVDVLAPLRLTSRYGLFTVMTTERHEIVLEGSHDGLSWTPFHLTHKPGPVERWPTFIAPFQPRLDWQFWFAALGTVERNPFVVATMRGLVEGRRHVRALFDDPPFTDAPPRAVRAVLYDYRLAPYERLRRDGVIWERTALGLYAPLVGAQFVDDGASSVMP